MMIKIKSISLFLCLWSINLFSQDMQIEWQQCYGGTEYDHALDILKHSNGYFIVGSTQSSDGDISFNHGGEDAWIIKTDLEGNLLWEKSYGGSQGDAFIRIFESSDKNYFLVGASNSSDGDISNDPYPDTFDFWVLKIDSSGAIIWDKIVGGNGDEVLRTGMLTNDGGIIALGYSGSEDGDVSVHYGYYDIWMVKLNSQGEIEWDYTIGNYLQDYGFAIIQTMDKGFLVGGNAWVSDGGNLNCETHGMGDGVLIKLDSLRNIEWQQCYGGSDSDGILGLIEIENGYVFVGYAGSNDGDISGWHGEVDIWVVKIDFNGNITWQKCLGGSRYESAKNIFQTNDNDFIIIGETQSQDGDVTGNHTQSEHDHDIWIVKLNAEGELVGQQCFGGLANEELEYGVIQKSNYNYVIAGNTDYGPSYDVQCTPHDDMYGDWWVFEAQDTSTGIRDHKVWNHKIRVYPNPAGDYVVFETHERDPSFDKNNSRLRITDVLGNEITQLAIKAGKTILDTRNFKAGVYLYSLQSGHIRQSGKLLILR